MKLKFAKCLKESFRQSYDEQFSFKYFLNIAFVRGKSPRLAGSFGWHGHGWVEVKGLNSTSDRVLYWVKIIHEAWTQCYMFVHWLRGRYEGEAARGQLPYNHT